MNTSEMLLNIVILIIMVTTIWILWLYGFLKPLGLGGGLVTQIDAGYRYIDYQGRYTTYLPNPKKRKNLSSIGVFIAFSGLIIGLIIPTYLSLTPSEAILIRFFGISLSFVIGISLMFLYFLGNFSLAFSFLGAAIVNHSQIIRLEPSFGDLEPLKYIVIIFLFITSWFIARGIFFALPNEKPNKIRQERGHYYLGLIGGVVTLLEFINIIYDLYILSI